MIILLLLAIIYMENNFKHAWSARSLLMLLLLLEDKKTPQIASPHRNGFHANHLCFPIFSFSHTSVVCFRTKYSLHEWKLRRLNQFIIRRIFYSTKVMVVRRISQSTHNIYTWQHWMSISIAYFFLNSYCNQVSCVFFFFASLVSHKNTL